MSLAQATASFRGVQPQIRGASIRTSRPVPGFTGGRQRFHRGQLRDGGGRVHRPRHAHRTRGADAFALSARRAPRRRRDGCGLPGVRPCVRTRRRRQGSPGSFTPALRDRLRAEADACARLQHPAIATYHQSGEWDGTTFIAMEYVRGQTLRRRLPPACRGSSCHPVERGGAGVAIACGCERAPDHTCSSSTAEGPHSRRSCRHARARPRASAERACRPQSHFLARSQIVHTTSDGAATVLSVHRVSIAHTCCCRRTTFGVLRAVECMTSV